MEEINENLDPQDEKKDVRKRVLETFKKTALKETISILKSIDFYNTHCSEGGHLSAQWDWDMDRIIKIKEECNLSEDFFNSPKIVGLTKEIFIEILEIIVPENYNPRKDYSEGSEIEAILQILRKFQKISDALVKTVAADPEVQDKALNLMGDMIRAENEDEVSRFLSSGAIAEILQISPEKIAEDVADFLMFEIEQDHHEAMHLADTSGSFAGLDMETYGDAQEKGAMRAIILCIEDGAEYKILDIIKNPYLDTLELEIKNLLKDPKFWNEYKIMDEREMLSFDKKTLRNKLNTLAESLAQGQEKND